MTAPRDPQRRGGTVALDVPHAYGVAQALLANDVIVDYRPNAGIRVAPHFYSSDDELERVVDMIDGILRDESWRAVRSQSRNRDMKWLILSRSTPPAAGTGIACRFIGRTRDTRSLVDNEAQVPPGKVGAAIVAARATESSVVSGPGYRAGALEAASAYPEWPAVCHFILQPRRISCRMDVCSCSR